jgi:hypothetical protein
MFNNDNINVFIKGIIFLNLSSIAIGSKTGKVEHTITLKNKCI